MPAPAWLGSAIAGVASTVGGLFSNQSNRREAQRDRNFQERMSSTAAQRAVADYTKAGLNPALAYDRPSSSPGGSQARLEDPVSKGVSSAMAAKHLQSQIDLTRAQTSKVDAEKALLDTDLSTRTVTGPGEETWRDEILAARRAKIRDFGHQGRLQPHDERLRALQVALAKAGLTAADFKAESLSDLDAVRDFIKRGISSAGEASKAASGWAAAGESRMRGMSDRLRRAAADVAERERAKWSSKKPKGGW